MLTVVSRRENLHNFRCRKSNEIDRCEVHREDFLPGLGIGMTIDDLQMAGIRHGVTELLKSAVRYSVALGPRSFR